MKNIKYFCGMLFLSFLLILQITSCGGGGDDAAPAPTPGTPFITSDLAGTWYMFATNVHGDSIGGSAGNFRGILYLDGLGRVSTTGSSLTRSNNQSVTLTGGLISIDSSGLLSGSATTNLKSSFYLVSGKMDATKYIMSFVAHTDQGEDDLVTAIRLIGGFSSLDMASSVSTAATWHVFGADGNYGEIDVSYVNDNISALVAAPGGGGRFVIDGNGLLNDTLTGGTSYVVTSSPQPANLYLNQGKISWAKDLMFFVSHTTLDAPVYNLATAIRAGGSFVQTDLTGTWFIYGTGGSGANAVTLSGTLTFDSGNVTGGSYTRSDGGVASVKGGTVTINQDGVISGSITTYTDGLISFASGKMNGAKGMMALARGANSSPVDFLFCIKGN